MLSSVHTTMPKPIDDLFERPVDLSGLVKQLTFEEDAVEEAARIQPKLLLEASRYRVMKLRRRMAKEFAYEQALANSRLKSRNKKNDQGKQKYTQGDASDIAVLDEGVSRARKEQDDAFIQEEMAKQLLECFKQRRDMLRTIATIRASEVSAEVRAVRENLVGEEMDKMRKRARAAADQLEDGEDDD